MATKNELIAIVEEFVIRVREVIALYSDASFGFGHLLKSTADNQKALVDFYKTKGLKYSEEEIENRPIISLVETAVHFDSLGTHYDAAPLHSSSNKETVERNRHLGSNEKAMSQLTIVMLYSLWEYSTRPRIEKLLNRKVQIGIFGELAHLRHCILKNSGTLDSKANKKLSVIKFTDGASILFTGGDLVELLKIISGEISNFVNDSFPPTK